MVSAKSVTCTAFALVALSQGQSFTRQQAGRTRLLGNSFGVLGFNATFDYVVCPDHVHDTTTVVHLLSRCRSLAAVLQASPLHNAWPRTPSSRSPSSKEGAFMRSIMGITRRSLHMMFNFHHRTLHRSNRWLTGELLRHLRRYVVHLGTSSPIHAVLIHVADSWWCLVAIERP